MSHYDPNYVAKTTLVRVGQKAIVLNSQKKFLVLLRSKKTDACGKWALPGGALEDREDPYESIQREIKEETGLLVSDIKPYHLRAYTNNEKDNVLIVGYICTANSENVIINWEHENYRWVSQEEALQLELTDDGKYFIEHFDVMRQE